MTVPGTVQPLLVVRDLHTSFDTSAGVARAVDGVTFSVMPHETVGLVGESGCGKSVTSLSILRLIRPPGHIDAPSRIELEGRDLLALPEAEMRRIRGNRIAMIFQEPMTALNPVFTVGDQIAEVARVHDHASKRDAWARAVEMLRVTGMADPAAQAKRYPHQLSGGMRQRVMIAMALMMRPALLIADEPTTALDVTIQAQILELLSALQRSVGMSMLLITHDLGVIAETASRVIVMYAGEVVEQAPVGELFAAPHHPYTQGLMRAMPRVGVRRERLATIPGSVPAPTDWPSGCRFHDRCPFAWERCVSEHPPLYQIGRDGTAIGGASSTSQVDPSVHISRCHLAVEPERRNTTHEPAAARAGTQ